MSKTAALLERQGELRKTLAEKIRESDEISDAVAAGGQTDEKGVHVNVTPEQLAAFREKAAEVRDIRETLRDLDAMIDAQSYLDAPDGKGTPAGAGGGQLWVPQAPKSIGQLFIESDEFKTLDGGRNGYTMPKPFGLKIHDLAGYALGQKDVGGSSGDIFTDMPSGTPGSFGRTDRVAMVPRPMRTFRVRDLFPAVPTTATVIEYFRVTGFTNAASPVPERDSGDVFGLKPRSSLTFVGEQANVRTIAHWVAAHRNVLSDEPGLRNVIDTELLYGLQLIEDAQILNGAGTSQDLLGILNVSGVQTQAQGSDTNEVAIRKAITKVALAEYEATGVVIHPSNWETIEVRQDNTGQFINAIVSGIAAGAEPRVWRLPVVQTQAISDGTALVGAFGIGATLYDREDATIRISENVDDWFVRNAVAILAEERLALTVQRPEAFCKVTDLD